jgi:pimeloyl-ACP methyl ester carboxylesterase
MADYRTEAERMEKPSAGIRVSSLAAPSPRYEQIRLPRTRLHCVTCGDGPPLIIVPATVSLISQWMPLAQFMGLRFKATFFELPGHGKSSPYPFPFSSHAVPQTVEALVDHLGYERFNLMGFSFGGLLALRTLEHLQDRIENVILLSPVVSCRAVQYSRARQLMMRGMAGALKRRRVRLIVHQILHSDRWERPLLSGISAFGNIDRRILEGKDALRLPISTLDVFAHTLDEILTTEYRPPTPFAMPCFFAMSVYDDLLDYELTAGIVRRQFSNLTMEQFYLPYHQPPHPPTFEWLMDEFGSFLERMVPVRI